MGITPIAAGFFDTVRGSLCVRNREENPESFPTTFFVGNSSGDFLVFSYYRTYSSSLLCVVVVAWIW